MKIHRRMAKISTIFRLWRILEDGSCECGNPRCVAVGKHPSNPAWSRTPPWEEKDIAEFPSHFEGHYGVRMDGLLVIDVDAKNGGVESFERLLADVPEISECGMVVNTGSGGGSRHLYFRVPGNVSLRTMHEEYKGIDFKSTGFVVGPGSRHKSGKLYELASGGPESITDAPQALLDILAKPASHRDSSGTMDVTNEEIKDMLIHLDPNCGYDQWYKIGMAIHQVTDGCGFELWDEWSATADEGNYPGSKDLQRKWDSFRVSDGGIGIGTLNHLAQDAGWVPSVTFDDPGPVDESNPKPRTVDLSTPPGMVGTVVKWINDSCRYPRETLAVAAGLHAVGAICALRYTGHESERTNLMTIGIAGSGSGKNAVIKAVGKLYQIAGLSPATYGRIKSERDLLNSLYQHQCAHYYMDELGEQLTKAMGDNVATHNVGVVGTIMEAMTSADSYMPIECAEKARIKNDLHGRLATLQKAIAENEDTDGNLKAKEIPRLTAALDRIEIGIQNPVLTLIGVASPVSIAKGLTRDFAENGFIRRSLVVIEKENNPRGKKDFKPGAAISLQVGYQLQKLAGDPRPKETIEHRGKLILIPTNVDALVRLREIEDEVHELAEKEKEKSGLVGLAREIRHNTLKISLVLAIPGGTRTLEHMEWAYQYALRNFEQTAQLVLSNDEDKGEALYSAIMLQVGDDWVKQRVITQSLKKRYKADDVKTALDKLVESSYLATEEQKQTRGPAAIVYRKKVV